MESNVKFAPASPDVGDSLSEAPVSKNCCVCGHETGAEILLTCALLNRWICRACGSHVKAQIEYIRSQEELAIAEEIILRHPNHFTFSSE